MKSTAYALFRFFFGWLMRVIFFVIPRGRKNEPKLSEGPYIVCSNHLSAVDPIMICAAVRRQQPRFMAKKELFSVPVLGWMIKGLGAFPVDRSGKDAGVLLKSVKMLQDGYCVGLFPQGTRRPGVDPATTPVRGGLGMICAKSKAQVLPVYLKTSGNRVRFLHPVRVIVGKPIPYAEYTRNGENAGAYQQISQYIFDRICDLGKEENRE